jgi:hypothetical protein
VAIPTEPSEDELFQTLFTPSSHSLDGSLDVKSMQHGNS